jgi:hypothetical protein
MCVNPVAVAEVCSFEKISTTKCRVDKAKDFKLAGDLKFRTGRGNAKEASSTCHFCKKEGVLYNRKVRLP